ncbi:hypothetical protein [Neoaquamicrobium microcysteis]|uniref:hypothetical protein n=1 Tax=Neoaquamicrobium microcysteis TaxID=2682781 RepID=UPI001375C5A0|nr:hypothetical protein [Mesorhizobium microcysteis]
MQQSPHFDFAISAADACVAALIDKGIPAEDIADAMLTKALAAWGAAKCREESAEALLTLWTIERDGI